jgi:selenocysteine-specific elongation factor
MTSAEVSAALGVPRAQVADELNRSNLSRLKVAGEAAFVSAEALDAATEHIERALTAFHEADPKSTGITILALRDRVDARLDPKVFDALLAMAVERGVALTEKGVVHHPQAASAAIAAEDEAATQLVGLLAKQGFTPDTVKQLAADAGMELSFASRVLGRLGNEGRVVRVRQDLFFSPESIAELREKIEGALSTSEEGMYTTELRDVMGVSRKYAIPLLEYFDSAGLTKRVGDQRVLRSR